METLQTPSWGGRGQGGLNLPLPVPFNPGSRPVCFCSRPFAFFRLRNIARCCIIFPFFSRFPPPWESRFPPPLLPPPVHLPPPFLPVSRPPVSPHQARRLVSKIIKLCSASRTTFRAWFYRTDSQNIEGQFGTLSGFLRNTFRKRTSQKKPRNVFQTEKFQDYF